MTCLIATDLSPTDALVERRTRILSAAERCFVRAGFHKTTMQDVAAEALMSAGNVYRYFASKDAVVAGLVARDRAEVAAGFETLRPTDPIGSLAALTREQIMERGRDTAALRLEISAEATRNPAVAAVVGAFEAEVTARLVAFFDAAVSVRGSAHRACPRTLAGLVIILLSGVMVHQAKGGSPEDAERSLADLLAIVDAALDGRLVLSAGEDRR